ncbi:DUF2515 family protein [Rossellomorea aquimaris]|uniref:DUF2515 domain-containing protein n=1 Tax=Rossellomorea aquimaris TaxID=189382 RepID=A0A5D4UFZ8_9BACI|nr:DUF2515 family protein [Rossellomorea aquimaris]TYS86477.1 DUF2515 domain-containing protein [Rossellomorea aquimaris]
MTFSPFQKFLNLIKTGNNDHTRPLLKEKSICELYNIAIQEPAPIVNFPQDLELYERIMMKVKDANLNNVTRTACYIDFFKKHPEIHWSFLAHMVSRNAGYHMTDLRNNLLSHVLSKKGQNAFFSFLELCNAAIFQDAYPQLLLYEQWKRTGHASFHLLKKFNVSIFMKSIWNDYLTTGNEQVLTIGLIMNEQHMIQKRILTGMKKSIGVEEWLFLLQDRLEFASILFPYGKHSPFSLAGLSLSHFEQVNRRILFGKKLYGILFHRSVFPSSYSYAIHHSHSGSRADYWPHIYSKEDKKTRLYSPTLSSAWDNMPSFTISPSDWFADQPIEVMAPLMTMVIPDRFSMTKKWKGLTSILVNLKRD